MNLYFLQLEVKTQKKIENNKKLSTNSFKTVTFGLIFQFIVFICFASIKFLQFNSRKLLLAFAIRSSAAGLHHTFYILYLG